MALQPIRTRTAPDDDLEIVEPLCAVFRRKLKGEGLKYTPERAAILDTVIKLDGLFEADTLLDEMKRSGFRVSKATVYRTIKLLEECGIIQAVLFDKDQSHYQLAYGQRPNTLIVNVDSGDVEAVEVPELLALRDRLCAERGLEPEGMRFQIFAAPAGR